MKPLRLLFVLSLFVIAVNFGSVAQAIALSDIQANEDDIYITDVNWGTVPVGVEHPREAEITNNSANPITITAVNWADNTHFTRIANLQLPYTIEPNESVVFIVYYKPTKPGVKDSTRAFFQAGSPTGKLYSDWVGRGSDEGPQIVGFDFGKRRVIDAYSIEHGVTEYKHRFSIKNVGGFAFDIEKIELVNDADNVFGFNAGQAPQTVEPGRTFDVDLTFIPKTEKEYNSKISMTVDMDGVQKIVTDDLKGIGTLPHIDLTGFELTDELFVGKSATGYAMLYSKRLSETTNMPLTVTGLTIEGEEAEAFEIKPEFLEQNPFPIILFAGSELEIPIVFTAIKPGEHNAVLKAIHNAPENPIAQLKGTGKPSPVFVSGNDFGQVVYTDSSLGMVYLSNNNGINLTINDIFLTGDGADAFDIFLYATVNSELLNPDFPFELEGKDTVEVYLTFKPTEELIYKAQVVFDVEIFGDYPAQLIGEGIAPDGVEISYGAKEFHILNAFPQPIKDRMSVEFYTELSGDISAALYDIGGRNIFRSNSKYFEAGKHVFEFNLQNKPTSGVYYLALESQSRKAVIKIVSAD